MPNLINLCEFKSDPLQKDPRLYFRNTYYYAGTYKFSVGEDYPHSSFIHCSKQKKSVGIFWIDLRKWVERLSSGDVLFDYINRNYKYFFDKSESISYWNKNYIDIDHGYWVFYFENIDDKSMFDLMYADKISSSMTKYHPDYPIEEKDAEKSYVSR